MTSREGWGVFSAHIKFGTRRVKPSTEDNHKGQSKTLGYNQYLSQMVMERLIPVFRLLRLLRLLRLVNSRAKLDQR